ncbi:hypothetical protein V3C99_003755 [Haemonchus contortus]
MIGVGMVHFSNHLYPSWKSHITLLVDHGKRSGKMGDKDAYEMMGSLSNEPPPPPPPPEPAQQPPPPGSPAPSAPQPSKPPPPAQPPAGAHPPPPPPHGPQPPQSPKPSPNPQPPAAGAHPTSTAPTQAATQQHPGTEAGLIDKRKKKSLKGKGSVRATKRGSERKRKP